MTRFDPTTGSSELPHYGDQHGLCRACHAIWPCSVTRTALNGMLSVTDTLDAPATRRRVELRVIAHSESGD